MALADEQLVAGLSGAHTAAESALQALALLQVSLYNCNTQQHTLQHAATHCNALQRTATHCNALQRTATHCNALQHTLDHALQHTLQRQRFSRHATHTATLCDILQRTATHAPLQVCLCLYSAQCNTL